MRENLLRFVDARTDAQGGRRAEPEKREPRWNNLTYPDGDRAGTFMLYSARIGALSYVLAVRIYEAEAVELYAPSPLAA